MQDTAFFYTELTALEQIRTVLLRNTLTTIKTAGTGHLGACCSSMDLMAALYFGGVLRYDSADPRHALRDYVLNRGHLGPLKYNVFHLLGWMREEEMGQYRAYGSRMAGHEDMELTPGVDISPCGSLGMGLSYAVGAAIGFRDMDYPNRVFAFLGDGEEEEGNVAEAARHAGHIKLRRLIAVIDRNSGQLSARLKETDSTNLHALWRAYGWSVIDLPDGHDLAAVLAAYKEALMLAEHGPVCIIARTVKGYRVPGCEDDYCGYHVYHAPEAGQRVNHSRVIDIDAALEALPPVRGKIMIPVRSLPAHPRRATLPPQPVCLPPQEGLATSYDTQFAYMSALERALGERLYIVTSDYPPRSFMYEGGGFALKRCRYINVGLREQHMTAMVHGLSRVRSDACIVVMCGDAFLYRHADQLNVLAQAKTPVVFYSVQGGLSGAQNGSTHQSSGQPGAMLMMPGIVVEEPSSALDFINASDRALRRAGPTYLRMQKMPAPWSYGGERRGGFEVVRFSRKAVGTVIGCGQTSFEVQQACERLERLGLPWNFINACTLSELEDIDNWILPHKPLYLYYNGNRQVLQAAIADALASVAPEFRPKFIQSMGFDIGATGAIPDLMRHFRLDADSIVERLSAESGPPLRLASA